MNPLNFILEDAVGEAVFLGVDCLQLLSVQVASLPRNGSAVVSLRALDVVVIFAVGAVYFQGPVEAAGLFLLGVVAAVGAAIVCVRVGIRTSCNIKLFTY